MTKISIRQLRDLIEAGHTQAEVSARLHISTRTVRRLCAIHEIQVNQPVAKLPATPVVLRMLDRGKTPTSIAEDYGVTPAAVHHRLYKAGLRLKSGRIVPLEQISEVA